jgi:adenosylcobinamide kinase/adenosylcobinamide-phosphate guanylyltransferase
VLILITGGVRSGKSRRALELSDVEPRIFIATATASDDEMRERIARHRAARDDAWIAIEEPLDVASALRAHAEGVVVVDCMTLWLANLIDAGSDAGAAVSDLVDAVRARNGTTILVTNELGMGVVPPYESGRRFRDLAGAMNQSLAIAADRVLLMVSGLEVRLK